MRAKRVRWASDAELVACIDRHLAQCSSGLMSVGNVVDCVREDGHRFPLLPSIAQERLHQLGYALRWHTHPDEPRRTYVCRKEKQR